MPIDSTADSPSRLKIVFALVISILAISSAATLIRLAEAPPLAIAAYRMGISGLIMWSIALFQRRNPVRNVNWLPVTSAGLFLALHFAFWISSLSHTSVASSLVLVTMNPVMVAIGSWLILKEKLTFQIILATSVSIIGCLILVFGEGSQDQSSVLGNALALMGALAMSSYMLTGRAARRSMDLQSYITWVYGIAGLTLVILSITLRQSLFGFSAKTFGYLILLALIPQIIGHSLINWALRYLHPSYLAAVILMEPLMGSLMAFFILKESVSRFTILGGALIVFGIIYLFTGSNPVKVDTVANSG